LSFAQLANATDGNPLAIVQSLDHLDQARAEGHRQGRHAPAARDRRTRITLEDKQVVELELAL
jgi:hypothetical protein